MEDCIFCKIARGDIPSAFVYEDGETFAFLSTGPVNPGHTLVIPKEHSVAIYDLSENSFLPVMRTVKKISSALKSGLHADGINVHMNNDAPAGQAVFHTHIHIIPRFLGDGYTHWAPKTYAPGEAEAAAEKIRQALTL